MTCSFCSTNGSPAVRVSVELLQALYTVTIPVVDVSAQTATSDDRSFACTNSNESRL